jgi:hypothetical protein
MNIWFPETIYFGGLAYSVLLMTTALVFYHMTRSKTLEMNPIASGVFSIILILISVIFTGVGIASYYMRLQEMKKDPDLGELRRKYLNHEIHIWYIYFVLGIIYMIVDIFIAISIIQGTRKALKQFNNF